VFYLKEIYYSRYYPPKKFMHNLNVGKNFMPPKIAPPFPLKRNNGPSLTTLQMKIKSREKARTERQAV